MGRRVVASHHRRPPRPPTISTSPPRPLACAPPTAAIDMMGSSSGSGPRYLNLVISCMPCELIDYLDSIPGASQDLHCYEVRLVGEALLSQPPRTSLPEENRRIMNLAQQAWDHAIYSRLCAPQMVGDPSNFTSDGELRHAAMQNKLSASRSRNHAATFPPLKENSNDGCVVMLEETSASNSGAHASAYVPSRAQALEKIIQNIVSPQELEQNHGTLELGTFWLCHPGLEHFTLKKLMLNIKGLPTVDIKGKRPAASEVDQINVKILRLNVASLVAQSGLNSAAGVLIRNDSTAEFISASCFSPILRTEPAFLFAAACCKGIKIALSYQPTTIVLESHSHLLSNLFNPPYAALNQQPDIVQLREFLNQGHPHFIVQDIPEEYNLAACRLALNVLHMKDSYMFFNDPPEWLVPYLDE